MQCQFTNCLNEPEFQCKICSSSILFCATHSVQHLTDSTHSIQKIDSNILEKIALLSLNLKIEYYISQITSDTYSIIHQIKEASKISINNLKFMNKNIKSLKDFKAINFDNEKVLSIIQNIKELPLDHIKQECSNLETFESSQNKEKSSVKYSMYKSSLYLEFKKMNFNSKIKYIQENWEFVNIWKDSKEFLISRNGLHLFHCLFYLGIED